MLKTSSPLYKLTRTFLRIKFQTNKGERCGVVLTKDSFPWNGGLEEQEEGHSINFEVFGIWNHFLSICSVVRSSSENVIRSDGNTPSWSSDKKWRKVRKNDRKLTVSVPAAVTNSWRARTDNACSMTNTHCDRSGGMFLSAMFSRKQCLLPNPSAAKQTRSPVAVHERHTMSSWNALDVSLFHQGEMEGNIYGSQEWNIILLRATFRFRHFSQLIPCFDVDQFDFRTSSSNICLMRSSDHPNVTVGDCV